MELQGKRILMLGDSITDFGQYPAMIEAFLRFKHVDATIFNLGVSSENTSGMTEPMHGFPRPNILNRVDRVLAEVKPDIVVCLYGINDGIYQPPTDEIRTAYKTGIVALLQKLKDYGAYTIMCTPTYFDVVSVRNPGKTEKECQEGALYAQYDDLMEEFREFVLTQIEADKLVDVHEAMRAFVQAERASNPRFISGDGIHPKIGGAAKIAEAILSDGFGYAVDVNFLLQQRKFKKLYDAVFCKAQQEHFYYKEKVGHDNIYKSRPLPEPKLKVFLKKAEAKIDRVLQKAQNVCGKNWNGFLRVDFKVDGKKGSVILPKNRQRTIKAVWKPEFLGAFTNVDCQFLQRGYALLYLDMPNLYGSDMGLNAMRAFYLAAQSLFQLNPKVGLIALSRAGLSAVRYAARYPKDIAFIYFDAPVFDAQSWPGGMGIGEGSPDDVVKMAHVYGIDSTNLAVVTDKMVAAAAVVKQHKIPVLIISNKEDPTVPFVENGEMLNKLLDSNAVKVMLKDEVGHHPHGMGDGSKICNTLIEMWK